MTRVLAVLALAACDDGTLMLPGSNTNSRVLAGLSQVRQPDPRGMFAQGVDFENYDERLRAAAFLVLMGMPRAEAVAALVDDGFTCIGDACSTQVVRRETWSSQQFGIRSPGPLRVFTYTYRVTVLGDEVKALADLDASVNSETQEWGTNG